MNYEKYLESENERLKMEKHRYFTILSSILSKMSNKDGTVSHKLLTNFDPSLYKIEQVEDYLVEAITLKLYHIKIEGVENDG